MQIIIRILGIGSCIASMCLCMVQSIMSFVLRFSYHAVDGIAVHLEGGAVSEIVHEDE